MSRAGYNDDIEDQWALIRWRGAVASSIKGKRGQAFLHELAATMDAIPEKRLIANAGEIHGEFCTLGTVAAKRGCDMEDLNLLMEEEDGDAVAAALGIAGPLAREIMFINDEHVVSHMYLTVEICGPMRPWCYEQHQRNITVDDPTAPARRWSYMRKWVQDHITTEPADQTKAPQ